MDADALSQAHRRLAVRLHPDRPGGSTAAMQEVNAAHDALRAHALRAGPVAMGEAPRPELGGWLAMARFHRWFDGLAPDRRLVLFLVGVIALLFVPTAFGWAGAKGGAVAATLMTYGILTAMAFTRLRWNRR